MPRDRGKHIEKNGRQTILFDLLLLLFYGLPKLNIMTKFIWL